MERFCYINSQLLAKKRHRECLTLLHLCINCEFFADFEHHFACWEVIIRKKNCEKIAKKFSLYENLNYFRFHLKVDSHDDTFH